MPKIESAEKNNSDINVFTHIQENGSQVMKTKTKLTFGAQNRITNWVYLPMCMLR